MSGARPGHQQRAFWHGSDAYNGDEIPDAIEPLVAYRMWRAEDGHALSVNFMYGWHPLVNEAACLAEASHPSLSAPLRGCSCGFYGLRSVREMVHQGFWAPQSGFVLGMVEFTGHVIVGTLGYRAQYARITGVFNAAPNCGTDHQQVAERYDVPVLESPVDIPFFVRNIR